MGIQDDVFDVEDALKETSEAAAFERIKTKLWQYEAMYDVAEKELQTIRAGARAIFKLAKEK